MTAMQRAKVLLRQPKDDVMTGYTPDGKQCFVDAGAWVKKPKKGWEDWKRFRRGIREGRRIFREQWKREGWKLIGERRIRW